MIVGLAAGLTAALTFGVAAVVQARAVRGGGDPDDHRFGLALVRLLVVRPLFWLAVLLNLAGFGFHLVAVDQVPLFVAQASISASLVVTAVLATLTLGEHLRGLDQLAVLGVVAGLALLSTAAGDHATRTPGPAAPWILLAVVAVIVAVALVVDRHGRFPVLLGALAGTLFATVSIAGRLVPLDSVGAALSAPAAWTLAAAGSSAFVVYSLGLRLGAVARVTAPVVVLQTLVPAVVGVVALGDSVRSGWVLAALLGLVAVIAGSLALGRFEATGHVPTEEDGTTA